MTKPKIKVPESPKDIFDDQVVKSIQLTTIAQREEIAREFEKGNVFPWYDLSYIGVLPVALLVASLVDAESPIVFNGRMKLKKPTMLELGVLVGKLPLLSTVSHSSVDKWLKTVDNPVGSSVDKLALPVDMLSVFAPKVINLSTGVLITADLSTKLSTSGLQPGK